MGRLTTLKRAIFNENSLNGTLPTELSSLFQFVDYSDYPEKRFLELQKNSFTGNFPSELGRLSILDYLDVSENGLTGTLPTEVGRMVKLVHLYLSSNSLTGNCRQNLAD